LRTHFGQLMNVENDRIERLGTTRAESKVESRTIEEVERVLRKVRRAKQQVQMTSCWKHGRSESKTGLDTLLEIFNTIMEREKMPDKQRNSTSIPIFKNEGDIKD